MELVETDMKGGGPMSNIAILSPSLSTAIFSDGANFSLKGGSAS